MLYAHFAGVVSEWERPLPAVRGPLGPVLTRPAAGHRHRQNNLQRRPSGPPRGGSGPV